MGRFADHLGPVLGVTSDERRHAQAGISAWSILRALSGLIRRANSGDDRLVGICRFCFRSRICPRILHHRRRRRYRNSNLRPGGRARRTRCAVGRGRRRSRRPRRGTGASVRRIRVPLNRPTSAAFASGGRFGREHGRKPRRFCSPRSRGRTSEVAGRYHRGPGTRVDTPRRRSKAISPTRRRTSPTISFTRSSSCRSPPRATDGLHL
jgi:hypothetical protein